jgi:hypothetical protein
LNGINLRPQKLIVLASNRINLRAMPDKPKAIALTRRSSLLGCFQAISWRIDITDILTRDRNANLGGLQTAYPDFKNT